jgi:sulfur carrier protein ThiS
VNSTQRSSANGGTFVVDLVGEEPRAVESGLTIAQALAGLGAQPERMLARLNGRLVEDLHVAFPKPGDVVLVDARVAGA